MRRNILILKGGNTNMTRLQEKYQKEVIPAMIEKFGYKNIMEVPKLEKIVINMGR